MEGVAEAWWTAELDLVIDPALFRSWKEWRWSSGQLDLNQVLNELFPGHGRSGRGLVDRANVWLRDQHRADVVVTNMQSLMVVKDEGQ